MIDLDRLPVATDPGPQQTVPIVDLDGLLADGADSAAAAGAVAEIAGACRSWGFFQVVNHGIDAARIERVWRATRAVFALPPEMKRSVIRSRENPWGYYDNELTKNQRDKKEVYDICAEGIDPIYHQQNRWIDGETAFRDTMLDYLGACSLLSLQLLEAFCVGLDLPPQYLRAHFDGNHTGFLRLNYYPVADPLDGTGGKHLAEADLGVHHHTDAGALTVLLQDDIGGLQVFREGYWYPISPEPGALVINTGDMMQVWSNDIYRAAIHRVLAMEESDRYSLPFFFNPAANTAVEPLPTVIDATHPARYRQVNWSDFRGQRTDGDFADYGTEVQISQFQI